MVTDPWLSKADDDRPSSSYRTKNTQSNQWLHSQINGFTVKSMAVFVVVVVVVAVVYGPPPPGMGQLCESPRRVKS